MDQNRSSNLPLRRNAVQMMSTNSTVTKSKSSTSQDSSKNKKVRKTRRKSPTEVTKKPVSRSTIAAAAAAIPLAGATLLTLKEGGRTKPTPRMMSSRGRDDDNDDDDDDKPKSSKGKKETKEEAKDEVELKTCPWDPRFPNQNQVRHCFVSYVDFQRCTRILGDDDERCEYFKKCFQALCPNAWVEKWDEEVENGTFAGDINPPKKKK